MLRRQVAHAQGGGGEVEGEGNRGGGGGGSVAGGCCPRLLRRFQRRGESRRKAFHLEHKSCSVFSPEGFQDLEEPPKNLKKVDHGVKKTGRAPLRQTHEWTRLING